MVNVQEKLDLVRFNVDKEPHIKLHNERCETCDTKPCLWVCPAKLFSLSSDGEMLFVYDNCFECGTCYVACPGGAIEWDYPQGGFGVTFRAA